VPELLASSPSIASAIPFKSTIAPAASTSVVLSPDTAYSIPAQMAKIREMTDRASGVIAVRDMIPTSGFKMLFA
jgi:hypothetical protein